MTTSIQILHASDLEGGVDAIENAPNFAAVVDALETDAAAQGIGSILLSAGDNYIPGPFFNAAQFIGDDIFVDTYSALFAEDLAANPGITLDVGDGRGNADIAIANILGIDASAVGNHEFDNGPDAYAGLIAGEGDGDTIESFGALFPYLSANLDFSGEPALSGLVTGDILAASEYQLAPSEIVAGAGTNARIADSTIVDVDGEQVGVLGATYQIVSTVSSTGGVVDETGGANDMAALAANLQPDVDALIAQGVDKVVLVTHLQDFNREQELATRLEGVDIIVAGGSDTISADETDALREGDEADQPYPFVATGADGNPVAIVSTDGEYSYVGRLVIDFDENGVIIPDSVDAAESGAFATDEDGVLAATGTTSVEDAIAGSEKATLVSGLTTAVSDQVTESDGTVFGETEVFLDGRRETVRTEESNIGNLTADANIAAARSIDPDVTVSIKNGGGIRAAIGEIDGETGELLPTQDNPASGKNAGEISELDIQNALRFDNELAIVDLSAEDLKIILEHAVASSGPGSTPGQFFQLGGLRVSVDLEGTAQALDGEGNVTTEGTRIQNVALIDESGQTTEVIVADGEVAEGAPESIKTVTLNFLAGDEGDLVGGDGYPFRALSPTVTETGIGEQQALQDYLAANFPVEGDAAFDTPEIPATLDGRVQFTDARTDTVAGPEARDELTAVLATVFQGESDPDDEDSPEGASEVVAHEAGRLYVTNGNLDRIDVFDIAAGAQAGTLELSGIEGFDGVQSVAVRNGIVAAAVEIEAVADGDDLLPSNGVVAFFDAASATLLDTVEVGVLPDAVAFTPDGSKLVVTNEGEFNSESDVTVDAPGSVSVIDVTDDGAGSVTFAEASRFGPGDVEGIADLIESRDLRIDPGLDPVLQHEPEFAAISPDGSTAFVSFQENNWIASYALATGEITGLVNAGTVDHSVSGADFADDDVIDISTAPVKGLRQPDAIAIFETDGEVYFATANEGDGRGDAFEFDDNDAVVGTIPEGDEARVSEIIAAAEAGFHPGFDESVDTTGLGRLIVSTVDGDTDGDGDIDEITSFGGRSFTIFDTAGNVVFDSGSEFEEIVANLAPERFLDDDGELGQNRADAKGVEPEVIEIGRIGQQSFAFIGLERDSGVMVYNVSEPEDSRFVTYIDGFEAGNLAPEIIEFIPAAQSTSDSARIAVSYEVTGTTALYDLARLESDVATEAYFEVALGREAAIAGYDFWSDVLESGNVERAVADAFDRSPEFQDLTEGLSDAEIIDLVFNNARERDATEAEQAEYAPEVAERGFDGLFFDLVNSDDAFLA